MVQELFKNALPGPEINFFLGSQLASNLKTFGSQMEGFGCLSQVLVFFGGGFPAHHTTITALICFKFLSRIIPFTCSCNYAGILLSSVYKCATSPKWNENKTTINVLVLYQALTLLIARTSIPL